MNAPFLLAVAGAKSDKAELLYVWDQATPEGKAIIVCLLIFSIIAWSVMFQKAFQVLPEPFEVERQIFVEGRNRKSDDSGIFAN